MNTTMFACEWVKEHWGDKVQGELELLVTHNDEFIQCVAEDGSEDNLAAYHGSAVDLSHAPCEWIKKHWYDTNPDSYPCEWIRLNWNKR